MSWLRSNSGILCHCDVASSKICRIETVIKHFDVQLLSFACILGQRPKRNVFKYDLLLANCTLDIRMQIVLFIYEILQQSF